jgi:hypothetical protein
MFTAIMRRARRMQADGENGVAFITVLGLSAVLFALVGAGMVAAAGATSKAGHDSDWTAALDAAYAGVADYEARLTNDNTYQQYGNKNAPFSASTGSTSLVMPTGTNANPAFNYLASDPWSPVPHGSGNQAFRYEVDNSQYSNTGTIRLLATGRSGDVTRSIIANVRQRGFIDYMYFTDYEVQDPQITGKSTTTCTVYWYDNHNRDNNCGGAIQFTDGDTFNGPIDSNDAMYICGGDFLGPVTTAYDDAPFYRDCSDPHDPDKAPTFATINGQKYPQYDGKLTMPVTNSQMLQETRGDLTTSTVPRPGCLYTGPTSITFIDDGADKGKMQVYSPFTKFSNFATDASGKNTGIANTAQCGTPGTSGIAHDAGQNGTLGKYPGATLDVPAQNLIYVQSEPSSSNDPNYTASSGALGTDALCEDGGNALKNPRGTGYPVDDPGTSTSHTSGSTTVTTTVSTEENPTKYGKNNTLSYYGCRTGDAFVNGTVKGQVTVAADNFVYITGDLTYASTPGNILGLVGQNAVWVWNPSVSTTTTTETCKPETHNHKTTTVCSKSVSSPSSSSSYAFPGGNKDRVIDAAILSVAHTFQVQDYDSGDKLGNLTVLGAIAQKYRGPVGTSGGYGGGTGFLKDYTYDTRLRSIAPPKFLQAVSTTYGVTQFADVPAAYDAKGNAK